MRAQSMLIIGRSMMRRRDIHVVKLWHARMLLIRRHVLKWLISITLVQQLGTSTKVTSSCCLFFLVINNTIINYCKFCHQPIQNLQNKIRTNRQRRSNTQSSDRYFAYLRCESPIWGGNVDSSNLHKEMQ